MPTTLYKYIRGLPLPVYYLYVYVYKDEIINIMPGNLKFFFSYFQSTVYCTSITCKIKKNVLSDLNSCLMINKNCRLKLIKLIMLILLPSYLGIFWHGMAFLILY